MVKLMNFPGHNRLNATILIATLFSTLLSGCQRGTEIKSRHSMVELSPRLQALFEKTRKVCFSRFLIEIPSTATVVYGPAAVEAPIDFYKGEADKIPEHLKKLLTKIEEERDYFLKDEIRKFPLHGKIIDGIVPGQKFLFGSSDQVTYNIYTFVPVQDDLFILEGSSFPEDDATPTLNRIASHLRHRSEDEIPADPGMCIEGGFVPLEQKYERATIGIRLKEFPDAHLSIDVHKKGKYLSEDSLKLLREQAKESAEAAGLGAIFARTKVLRQRDRKLSIWDGEELALRTPVYKDNKSVHEFRFYSKGAVHDSLHPELDIRLDTGVKDNSKASVDPSLTDEEALMLWDKLITTIRLRQSSDATPTPAPPRAPLATLIRTGEPCPQTGWWECTESKKVEGDRRRLIEASEPMPHVLLTSDSGLWQKLTGNRSTHQVATVWKLVAYDGEPPMPPAAE
jgi:hypothetical protein